MPAKPRITKRRLNRIRSIVASLSTNPDKLRYDAVMELAKRHGVSYETIKSDLYAITYAFYPGPREYFMNEIPKNYRRDVKALRALAERGELDTNLAVAASKVFVKHAPWVDKDRIVRAHGINDQEVLRKVEEIGGYLEDIYKKRYIAWDAHPAKAYAFAWNHIGRKIHQELENAREITEKLHTISQKIRESKRLTNNEKQFLKKLGIQPEEATNYINPELSIADNLRNMYLVVLDHNLGYIRAIWHYEQARTQHIRMYRELRDKGLLGKLERDEPAGVGSIRSPNQLKLGDMIINNYKNIRRWNIRPGSKWVGFSKAYKELVKALAEEGMYKEGSYDPYAIAMSHMRIIGYHITKGDEIYSQLKSRERQDKIIRAIVKWRPRGGRP